MAHRDSSFLCVMVSSRSGEVNGKMCVMRRVHDGEDYVMARRMDDSV